MLIKLRNILKNESSQEAIWMTVEQFLVLALSFFVGIVVFRYLGPNATGAINYAAAIAGMFAPIATLGLESIIIREYAKGGVGRREIWQTARRLLWGVTALNIVALSTISAFQPLGSLQQFALFATAVSGFSNLSSVYLWAFRAESRYREIAKIRLLQICIMQAVRLAFVFSKAPFLAFALLIAIDPLITAIITTILARNRLPHLSMVSPPTTAIAFKLLHESWPLMITGLGIIIYMKIDLIMLERLTDIHSVGVYAAATRLSELFYLAPMIAGRAAFPKMVQIREIAPLRFKKFYFLSLALMGAAAVLMILAVQFGGSLAVSLLYGPKFAEATAPFIIHIWTTLPVCIGVAVSNSYQIEGETRPQMWACFIGAAVNMIVNLYTIPNYGPAGAAYATIAAQTVAVLSPIIFSKTCRTIAFARHV